MYYYSAFTLTFQSDLPLPSYSQLDTLPAAADVVIKRVQAPLDSSPAFHYQFEETLHLWAHEGKEIFYYTEETWEVRFIRMYILDYALIGLFYQRGWFPLHGGSVVMPDGKVMIITGPSGTGKSTTVTQFAAAGYPLLGDDIAVITFVEDKMMVLPAYPEISVYEHVYDQYKKFFTVTSESRRWSMPSKVDFRPRDVFQTEPAELSTMVFLDPESVENPTLQPISGSLAMQRLREQSLNYLSSVENFGIIEDYFQKAIKICRHLNLYLLSITKNYILFNSVTYLLKHLNNFNFENKNLINYETTKEKDQQMVETDYFDI